MVGIILAIIAATVLLLLLARYTKHPALLRMEIEEKLAGYHGTPDKPRITPERLREIARQLFAKMGLEIAAQEPLGRDGATRLEAIGKGGLRDTRYVIYLETRPVGEQVGPEVVIELAEDVNATNAAVGVLVSPFLIDRAPMAGVDAELALYDGLELRRLVKRHLPQLFDEFAGYHLTGTMVKDTLVPRDLISDAV